MAMPARIATLTYGIALLFLAIVVGAASSMIWHRYDDAINDGSGQTARFVRGAETALNRSLLGIDILLASMDNLLAIAEAAAPEQREPLTAQLMGMAVHQSVPVQLVAILQPDGRVVASSDRRGRGLSLSLPEGFLDAVLAPPVSTLIVSRPVESFLTSEKVIYVGRSLQLGDQSKRVAVAEVPIAFLVSLMNQGVDISGLEVTLERNDGQLLASLPAHDDLYGTRIAPPLTEEVGSGIALRMPARLTGAPALVAVRPTLYRTLLIAASLPVSAQLVAWRGERDVILGAAALFALIVALVSVFTHVQLVRQWRAGVQVAQAKRALDQALESMTEGFVLLDAQDLVLTWNRRFLELFPWVRGMMATQVPYRKILETTERYLLMEGEQSRLKSLREGRGMLYHAGQGEHELALPHGQVIQITRSRTPDGGMVCMYQDVTEKKRQTADIVEANAQLQATLDALPDLLLEVGLDGCCHRYHAPRIPLLAIRIDQLVGHRITDILPADAAEVVMGALREADTAGYSKGRQFERSLGQHTAWFEISASRKSVTSGDARFIVILREITKSKLAAQEIESLAFYDTLTGLPNRRLLHHRLQAALEKSAERHQHGAVLFLDLDDFKTLNDTRGHDMGDLLLKEVAGRLSATLGNSGTVARLGGDEFIVMLEGLSHNVVQAMAQTQAMGDALLDALNQPYQFLAQHYRSTASVGAVTFYAHENSLDDLFKQADIAMYYAKAAGGNALRFFDPGMQATITARATLETELRTALDADQFTLYYQSQVRHDGTIVGAEVLIRWLHPELGVVAPRGFISLAEETGLILPIGLWVLESACERLQLWSQDPARRDLQLAVNVSARQFRRDDFVEQVCDVLTRTGANPARLKLELTESLLLDQVDDTILKMNALKQIGVRFSMDDFGTGYSSLSYMTQLPLDQLKIDQFFVHHIGRNAKVGLIIQTIIGMASNLDLEIIAEGVETEEQRLFLERHGCPLCQGHLFSEPLPVEEFETLLPAAIVH